MNTKIIIIILTILAVIMIALYPKIEADNNRYNAYMCATQNLMPDCKTVLPVNERLK